MKTAVQELQKQTRELHQSLEQCAMACDLLSPALTLPRYSTILAVWFGAWTQLETCIWNSAWAASVPHLLPARRAAKAQHDLHILQSSAWPTLAAQSNKPPQLRMTTHSQAALLGVCYVVRGSALGGQVITRHLEQTLRLDRKGGASFFAPQDDEPLTWSQWGKQLEPLLSEPALRAEAAAAARQTFNFLLATFSGDGGVDGG